MAKFENRRVINRPSPSNEVEMIRLYKQANPKAQRHDGLDVSAVRTTTGQTGYALLPEDKNRSKDRAVHNGKDFISTSDLKKHSKK